ncbi:hypothetical protein SLEP1_g52164 [Rubroshorea leprosula]|uniref:Uncharacterized protein n=1 Tax=Rubroshorea leprosula TaxID=152421 RepID=A0AAV5M5H9_9ROSI|nr:hypothetical protein SLEP1_g52164 [Rubroshorea leprosula]
MHLLENSDLHRFLAENSLGSHCFPNDSDRLPIMQGFTSVTDTTPLDKALVALKNPISISSEAFSLVILR